MSERMSLSGEELEAARQEDRAGVANSAGELAQKNLSALEGAAETLLSSELVRGNHDKAIEMAGDDVELIRKLRIMKNEADKKLSKDIEAARKAVDGVAEPVVDPGKFEDGDLSAEQMEAVGDVMLDETAEGDPYVAEMDQAEQEAAEVVALKEKREAAEKEDAQKAEKLTKDIAGDKDSVH